MIRGILDWLRNSPTVPRIRRIANADLRLEDVPLARADWTAMMLFARTFDGYEYCGSFEAAATIANSRANNTLSELRTCLFFEQRRQTTRFLMSAN